MRAEKKDARIGVEDILRSVAVVNIPVRDQNPLNVVLALRVTRGDCDVVVDAEAHSARRRCMMTRRPHRAECVLCLARDHGIGGVQDTPGSEMRNLE